MRVFKKTEEIGSAVSTLWHAGKISTHELWMFAYEDGGQRYLPRVIETADSFRILSESTWQRKYHIMTTIYGFEQQSWEAATTPRAEAFWQCTYSNSK